MTATSGSPKEGGAPSVTLIAPAIAYAVEKGAFVINYSGEASGGGAQLAADQRVAVDRVRAADRLVVQSVSNATGQDTFAGQFAENAVGADRANKDWFLFAINVGPNGETSVGNGTAGPLADRMLAAAGLGVRVVNKDGGSETISGNSFAAPAVAGAAALLKQYWPQLGGKAIARILLDTATDAGSPGVDPVFGAGILNIEKAMQAQAPASSFVAAQAVLTRWSSLAVSAPFGGSATASALNGRVGGLTVLDRYGRDYLMSGDPGVRVRGSATWQRQRELEASASPSDEWAALIVERRNVLEAVDEARRLFWEWSRLREQARSRAEHMREHCATILAGHGFSGRPRELVEVRQREAEDHLAKVEEAEAASLGALQAPAKAFGEMICRETEIDKRLEVLEREAKARRRVLARAAELDFSTPFEIGLAPHARSEALHALAGLRSVPLMHQRHRHATLEVNRLTDAVERVAEMPKGAAGHATLNDVSQPALVDPAPAETMVEAKLADIIPEPVAQPVESSASSAPVMAARSASHAVDGEEASQAAEVGSGENNEPPIVPPPAQPNAKVELDKLLERIAQQRLPIDCSSGQPRVEGLTQSERMMLRLSVWKRLANARLHKIAEQQAQEIGRLAAWIGKNGPVDDEKSVPKAVLTLWGEWSKHADIQRVVQAWESPVAAARVGAALSDAVDGQGLTTIVMIFILVMLVAIWATARMASALKLQLGQRMHVDVTSERTSGALPLGSSVTSRQQAQASTTMLPAGQERVQSIADALSASVRREQLVTSIAGGTADDSSRRITMTNAGRGEANVAVPRIGAAGRRSGNRQTRSATRRDGTA